MWHPLSILFGLILYLSIFDVSFPALRWYICLHRQGMRRCSNVIDSDKSTSGNWLGKTSWNLDPGAVWPLLGNLFWRCFCELNSLEDHIISLRDWVRVSATWLTLFMGRFKVQILQTWFWTAGPVSPNFVAVSIVFSRIGSRQSYFPPFPTPQAMLCWRCANKHTPPWNATTIIIFGTLGQYIIDI